MAGEFAAPQDRVLFKRLHPAAHIPTMGSDNAAGYDLYASESLELAPGENGLVPLGFATAIPDSLWVKLESRSGMALRGVQVVAGVVDADYRGEWKVTIHNGTGDTLIILPGERIAQAVFHETIRRPFQTVEDLPATARGAGGWGSSGTR